MQRNHIIISGIILIISLWVGIRPMIHEGFWSVHDSTQIARIYAMRHSLQEGQFPVRWVDDLGYGFGYPLYNFYAPLPYYIAAAFTFLPLSLITAAKLMLALSMVISALTMAFFIYQLNKNVYSAIFAAVLYVVLPYRAIDLYVRAAVGELWVMAFFPLVIWSLFKISKLHNISSKHDKAILPVIGVGSIALAASILSHTVTSMIILLGIGVYIVISGVLVTIRKIPVNIFVYNIMILTLGIGLSAFFIVPAWFEQTYTNTASLIKGGSDYHLHFLFIDQLWSSPWGFGGSGPGRSDGMSFMIGKLHIILAGVSCIWLIYLHIKKTTKYLHFFSIIAFILLLSCYMTLPISQPVWESIAVLAFIQYPWRFLLFIGITISILGAQFLIQTKKYTVFIFLIVSSIVIGYNSRYFYVNNYSIKSDSDETSLEALQWRNSKISDEYLAENFLRPKNKADIRRDTIIYGSNISIRESDRKVTRSRLVVESAEEQRVIAGIAYFPGWTVLINNEVVQTENVDGKLAFNIGKGTSEIAIKLHNTLVQLIANCISIGAGLLVLGMFLYDKKAKN